MNRRHRQTPFQNKTNFEPYPMLRYVVAHDQYIGRSKRHQYHSPLVEFLAKFTIRTNTNAFFASHDYSRRFRLQIYTFFSIPMPKKIRLVVKIQKISEIKMKQSVDTTQPYPQTMQRATGFRAKNEDIPKM